MAEKPTPNNSQAAVACRENMRYSTMKGLDNRKAQMQEQGPGLIRPQMARQDLNPVGGQRHGRQHQAAHGQRDLEIPANHRQDRRQHVPEHVHQKVNPREDRQLHPLRPYGGP
jgi:hypothetical protein